MIIEYRSTEIHYQMIPLRDD